MSVSGLVRVHGPVDQRCLGSNQQPQPEPIDNHSSRYHHSHSHHQPASQRALSLSPQLTVPPPADPTTTTSSSGSTHSQIPTVSSGAMFSRQAPHVRLIGRIPRGSRDQQASAKLTTILEGVVSSSCTATWERIFYFCVWCLRVPPRGGRRWSLVTLVNKQLHVREETHPSSLPTRQKGRGVRPSDSTNSLRRRVSTKLEEGDLGGAVCLACFEDSIAKPSNDTYTALQRKHPSPRAESVIPAPPVVGPDSMAVTEAEVLQAIKSFPCSSAGGHDGLRPQHLKDMLRGSEGNVSSLLSSLSAFATLVLEGRVPPSVRPFFF